jgi:hypothetical protein
VRRRDLVSLFGATAKCLMERGMHDVGTASSNE